MMCLTLLTSSIGDSGSRAEGVSPTSNAAALEDRAGVASSATMLARSEALKTCDSCCGGDSMATDIGSEK